MVLAVRDACWIDALCTGPLLEAQQRRELPALREQFGSGRELAAELVQRGWLTPFQARQVQMGKAEALTLGPYNLLERIGEGGMGQVYKALHRGLQRYVALKVIRRKYLSQPRALQRFLREIRAAGQLSHPHVVRTFDADLRDGVYYIAMEFVDGVDLAQLVHRNGPLPVAQACDYIRQAALGLDHALSRGLVHRDVKPANLFVAHGQTRPRASSATLGRPRLDAAVPDTKTRIVPYPWGMLKILDLGLVRLTEPQGDETLEHLTHHGAVMGTPEYIAPEQARDSNRSDIRSDLYSLGCTFFYLLTGQPPFPHGSLTEKLLQHQMDTPPLVNEVRSQALAARSLPAAPVPAAVERLLDKLLAKDPDERFQTPLDLAAALQVLQGQMKRGVFERRGPANGLLTRASEPMPRRRPRWHWTTAAVGIVGFVLGVASVLVCLQSAR